MADSPHTAPADAAPDGAPPVVEAPAAEAPPKKRGRLLLVLPVLALLAGGGLGYARYQEAAGADADAPIEYGEFLELPGFIINPADSGGRRYLMVDLGFEAADAKALEALAEHEVVVRDAIVGILSEQSVEELAAVSAREALKDSLRARVNGLLEHDVDRLYFTQYVLQ